MEKGRVKVTLMQPMCCEHPLMKYIQIHLKGKKVFIIIDMNEVSKLCLYFAQFCFSLCLFSLEMALAHVSDRRLELRLYLFVYS